MTPSLMGRVGHLVQTFHGGSVNRAAQAMNIPQATLNRIVAGTVTNPRTGVLQAIASFHGTSVDWLLSGRGQPPADAKEGPIAISGEWLKWRALVESLDLSDTLTLSLLTLPSVPVVAWEALSGQRIPRRQRGNDRLSTALAEAFTAQVSSWIVIVQTFVDLHGVEACRRAFEQNEVNVLIGFNEFAAMSAGRGKATNKLREQFLKSDGAIRAAQFASQRDGSSHAPARDRRRQRIALERLEQD